MKKLWLFTLVATLMGRRTVIACNIGEGTSPTGKKTFITESVVPTRYVVATQGSAAGKVALCDDAKKPLGLYTDESVDSDAAAVDLFGAIQGTRLVVAATAVAAGNALSSDATGQAVPAVAGKWTFGTALGAAAAGELVEFVPAHPHKI